MAPQFIRNREEFEHMIVTMHRDGLGIRGLVRHFKVGRNTIRRILRKHHRQREEGHDRILELRKPSVRHSRLDTYEPVIKQILDEFPDITGLRLFEELKNAGYQGKITIVRDRLRKLRPGLKREPEIRFETEPGVQSQMDWSPYTIPFLHGGKATVLCFSYILAFSRRHYIDFTLRRDFYTLIRRHQDVFEYFGGVARQCLYDGEKTVILRWEAGSPVFNPAFIQFITHYQCKPIACRPARPETKGKIEAPFQYVERNLLNGRHFLNLEDLREKARWWMREKSDLHKHDTTGRPPRELFLEQEQTALQPLPGHPYDTCEVALRVCRFDGFIEHETNFYSVPYEHIGNILAMKVTEHEIFIYGPDIELVACHERLPAGACKIQEKPEHRRLKKIRYGLEPVREAFLRLGETAEAFLQGLKEKFPRNCGFHARLILQLREQYHADDIHLALAHAGRYQAFDAKAVERILRAKATPRTLESIRVEKAREVLEKSLPPIKQRSLDEYCHLLGKETSDEERRPGKDSQPSEDPETNGNREVPQ
jgi:transposase